MIYIEFPVGGPVGWSICGRNIARELSMLTPVRLLTMLDAQEIGDEVEHEFLRTLLISAEDSRALMPNARLNVPILQYAYQNLEPPRNRLRGTRTIGYTFFEDDRFTQRHIDAANAHFDHLAAGSTWCENILRERGIKSTSTILQGIDSAMFFPIDQPRQFFRDHFVMFSGGKFEFRKGQDIVIRAVKVMQQRHKDVLLVAAWYNMWPQVMATMSASPHIRFLLAPSGDYIATLRNTLAANGLALSNVILLGPRHQHTMPRVYWNSDIGIFPNRVEGGTNLVLMEYMACGKPVIATNTTGHADVVTSENAMIIEPDIDQAVERLEWAYENRDRLKPFATRAADDMAKLTWRRSADQFLVLLQ
jgi:glycosyltransferase involved in cell wall biosynthesis